MSAMAELHIARSMAEVLDKLQHSSDDHGCASDHLSRKQLGSQELVLARLHAMTAESALLRARATGCDFKTAMVETEFKVSMELARILTATVDPVLEGLRKVVVEEGGDVCGVCQDEMDVGDEARAIGCMHKFHGYCIFKWLKHKNACPLCRFHVSV